MFCGYYLLGGLLTESLNFSNMIISAFLSILAWVISGFALILPTGNFLPANFSDLVSDLITYAYGWDWIIPMTTLFSVLSAIILFEVATFGWRSGKYFISLLRGN